MARLNKWELQHLKNLSALDREIERIFEAAIKEAARIGATIGDFNPDRLFSFSDYPITRKRIEKLLSGLKSGLSAVIVNGINSAWTLSNNKNNELARQVFGDNVGKLSQAQYRHYFSTNDEARRAFIERKTGGLNLSDRVWRYTEQFKEEIELGLDVGIRNGVPAEEMTKELRQYLKHPDKLFRRVRDEHGILRLSKRAAAFHPGQGVYRSSFKNARRLAVTEMNAAYRRAEWESYQNNPLIIGYEIRLSNNHTVVINGKLRTLYDICDVLAGRYPKTFLWTGWHPHCRCEMVPIFISESDFRERIRARKAGKLKDWKPNPQRTVTQVPKALTDWIAKNEERSKGWKTLPYFVRDNRKSIGTLPVNTYTAEERKFTRARSTAEAMERATQLLSTLYPDIQNTELAALHHYTQQGGNYRQLNKQLDKGTLTDFNKASASLMAKALEELPKYRGTVYRGAIMKRKDYERLYAGKDEVKHAIFTSSTKTPAVAYRFASYRDLKKTEVRVLFEIQSKNGRDISDISEFNGKFAPEDQREVLFTNGTRFKIVKHEISGQEVRITLVEL